MKTVGIIVLRVMLGVTLLGACKSAPQPAPAIPPPPPAAPPACDRVENIQLDLLPMAQLNPDREGYPRSVVVRIYQLEGDEAFSRTSFEELWLPQAGLAASAPSVVSGPEELTLIPGRTQTKLLKRHPRATHVGVAAKFREHHPEAGWRVLTLLPTPRDPCQYPSGPRLAVELQNFLLRLR